MKKLPINKRINTKWLTAELQAANVRIATVASDGNFGYAEIDEADEALAIPVINAHDPGNNPETKERTDLANFYQKIENELVWIPTARQQIINGKTVIDNPNSNLAQVKQVVSGLLDLIDRILREQEEEMKSWKYVTRRLK